MNKDERASMAAQAPLPGAGNQTNERATLDLDRKVREIFPPDGEPRVVIDGEVWVKLPDCPGCMSMRYDKIKRRWFHDPKCQIARRKEDEKK